MSKITRDQSMLGGVTHLRNDVDMRDLGLVVVNNSTINLLMTRKRSRVQVPPSPQRESGSLM